jgi:hypothetical protein
MNKQDVKKLREIANRLPVVYEQTVSGFYEDYNQEGEMVKYPNIVNHPVNHVRRLRKAYESRGMDGVHWYLDEVRKLQEKRRENAGL